jgi:catechol 2,3-dioxygenase-like lactoylglutathione lyase family enzyme
MPASEYHVGRLIDHVHLRTRDLEASKRFYRAVTAVLGIPIQEHGGAFSADELYVDEGDTGTHVHLAFQARDQQTVRRFHAAALAAGGRDNGGPGERAYHPGYFAAFVLDPDGNNIEAVFHGPSERSADDVVIRPGSGA